MSKSHQTSIHYFGESACFGNDEEKKQAKIYLELWKFFFIAKHYRECVSVEIIDEQWIERDPQFDGILAQRAWLSLKLGVKIKFKFEINPLGLTD